jgi:hypothetical protein
MGWNWSPISSKQHGIEDFFINKKVFILGDDLSKIFLIDND